MRAHIPAFYAKRQAVLFIWDYSCVLCGLVNVSNHVHHIDFNKNNNDAFNFVPLCLDCHKMVHKTGILLSCKPNRDQEQLLKKLNSSM